MGEKEMEMARICLLLLAVCVGVAVPQQNSSTGWPSSTDASDDAVGEAEQELQLMDVDGDGKVSLDEITAYFRKEFYGEQLNKVELADSQTTETDLDQMARTDAKEFLEDLDSNKDNFLSVEELASQYSVPDESDNDSSDSEDSDDFQEYLRDFEDRSEYDYGTDDNDDGTDDNEYESEFIEVSYKEEQYPGEE